MKTIKINLGKINNNRVREAVNTLLWKARTFEKLSTHLNANNEREGHSTILTEPFANPDETVVQFLDSLTAKYEEVNETNFKQYLTEVITFTEDYTIKVRDERQSIEELRAQRQKQEQVRKEREEAQQREDAETKAKGLLTVHEKISLSTKEIAQKIRTQLKTEFENCTFSVRTEYYSGGSSIHVSLMQSVNLKVIQDFNELSENAVWNYQRRHDHVNAEQAKQNLKKMQEQAYHQLSTYRANENYNPDEWNNGVFLTKEGFGLFKRVSDIINYYNYDHSDAQTDYFDVNFYVHLNIGTYEKPYRYVEQAPSASPKRTEPNNKEEISIIKNEAKNGVEIHFKNKPATATLEELKNKNWHWSNHNKCWYKTHSAQAEAEANQIKQGA